MTMMGWAKRLSGLGEMEVGANLKLGERLESLRRVGYREGLRLFVANAF